VFDGKEDLDVVEEPYVAGTQAFLVSGFQARNNAQIVVTSSLDMFSDEYLPNAYIVVNWTDSILCKWTEARM
jgi:hypothetical protein